jgi:hypothetical protein
MDDDVCLFWYQLLPDIDVWEVNSASWESCETSGDYSADIGIWERNFGNSTEIRISGSDIFSREEWIERICRQSPTLMALSDSTPSLRMLFHIHTRRGSRANFGGASLITSTCPAFCGMTSSAQGFGGVIEAPWELVIACRHTRSILHAQIYVPRKFTHKYIWPGNPKFRNYFLKISETIY